MRKTATQTNQKSKNQKSNLAIQQFDNEFRLEVPFCLPVRKWAFTGLRRPGVPFQFLPSAQYRQPHFRSALYS